MTTASTAAPWLSPLVRTAVLPGLGVGVLSAAVATMAAGAPGFYGAMLGSGLVMGFFWTGQAALQAVRATTPGLFLIFGMLTYALQVVGLLAVFSSFRRNPAWAESVSTTSLAVTVIACTVVWTAGLVVASTRDRTPLYDLGGDAR